MLLLVCDISLSNFWNWILFFLISGYSVQIKSLSKYSPLDLFSGNVEGINKALVDLVETPQNNVRVFLAGAEIFGGQEDGGSTDEAVTSLDEKLAAVSVAPDGERVPAFQRLVATALNKSKILDQLLRVQKLDAYDIEGAILAYKKFMRMTDDAGQLWLYSKESIVIVVPIWECKYVGPVHFCVFSDSTTAQSKTVLGVDNG